MGKGEKEKERKRKEKMGIMSIFSTKNRIKKREIKLEVERLRRKERKKIVREEAEKIVYGGIKTKRIRLTNSDRDETLSKFNNK